MINKTRESNISNSFAAALSFTGDEKIAEYSLAKEDKVIEKYAGINIYQPTVDNIEMFVKKYVMNELAFFPRVLKVDINIFPNSFDNAHRDWVSDASGVVSIKLHDANIELPFLISDGELVPFDVIQMNKQRVPFSRENLKRVILGVEKTFADKVNGVNKGPDQFKPYLGVEKPANPSTSSGFLGNVLQIQEQHIRRGGDENYITASTKLEEGMEKLSSMKPLTMKEVEILENEFKKKASIEFEAELTKFAAEVESYDDSDALKLFRNLDDLQFENASSLSNGAHISFPERNGSEMSMTKGVVLSNFMSAPDNVKPQIKKVILAEDGRIKLFTSNENFLALKGDGKFKPPTKSIASLLEDDTILAFNGDKILAPARVNSILLRGLKNDANGAVNDIEFKILNMSFLYNDFDITGLGRADFRIYPLEGANFETMPLIEYVKKLAEKTGLKYIDTLSLFGPYNSKIEVLCTDFDATKVVITRGIIEHFLRDKSELRKLTEASEDLKLTKSAGEGETVYVKSIDRQRKIYYVQIKYVDKSKTIFKSMSKEYRDVPDQGVKQILRVLGYDGGQAAEIMYKADTMGSVTMPLPTTARVDMLTGANVTNRSIDSMKKVMNKVVNPRAVGDAVITSALGGLISGAIASRGNLMAGRPDVMRDAIGLASKFAEESEGLSVAFEKLARELQSTSMLKVAKYMSANVLLQNKTLEVLNGECYPRLVEASYDIARSKEELEKTAYELMELKVNQYANKNHIVNPNYIQGAIVQLDNMYKLAYELVQTDEAFAEKLATDMADIPGTPQWEEKEKEKEKKEEPKKEEEKGEEKKADQHFIETDSDVERIENDTNPIQPPNMDKVGPSKTNNTESDSQSDNAEDNKIVAAASEESVEIEKKASEALDEMYKEAFNLESIGEAGKMINRIGKAGGAATGALGGAALGGVVGGISGGEGHHAQGALTGMALGAVGGGLGGAAVGNKMADLAKTKTSSTLKTLGAGAALGAAPHVVSSVMKNSPKAAEAFGKAKGWLGKNVFENEALKGNGVVNGVKNFFKKTEEVGKGAEQTMKNTAGNLTKPEGNLKARIRRGGGPAAETTGTTGTTGSKPKTNFESGVQEHLDNLDNAKKDYANRHRQYAQDKLNNAAQGTSGEKTIITPAPQGTQETLGNKVSNAVETAKNKGKALYSNLMSVSDGSAGTGLEGKHITGSEYKDKGIEKTASSLLDSLYIEKLSAEQAKESHIDILNKKAAMNVPDEAEKKKESNGENLADITCEVCGYKGQPTYVGKCPTCGSQGGIKPSAHSDVRGDAYGDSQATDNNNLREQLQLDIAYNGENNVLEDYM